MTIRFRVLGNPGRDNCLFVQIDTGQANHRLLFDCGDGCLQDLSVAEIQAVDHLFFSHFHMDHIAGFDSFFRCNYNRTDRKNVIWGPPNASPILQHRFQGYWWNLCEGDPACWQVRDIASDAIEITQFRLSDGFQAKQPIPSQPREPFLLNEPDYTVDAIELDHNGPSIGYLVREKDRENIDLVAVREAGLAPGPWMQKLKGEHSGNETIELSGQPHVVSELRHRFVQSTPGDSIAYLTDFYLDEETQAQVVDWLRGCQTLVCEAQYRQSDEHLATQNRHMTTHKVGQLAQAAGVGQLILFHLSSRYTEPEWREMEQEAQDQFANTSFPEGWFADEEL